MKLAELTDSTFLSYPKNACCVAVVKTCHTHKVVSHRSADVCMEREIATPHTTENFPEMPYVYITLCGRNISPKDSASRTAGLWAARDFQEFWQVLP